MKKLILILLVMCICSLGYGRNNNFELSLPDMRTYWSQTKTVCHPQWDLKEIGIYFGPDSLFDWYKIMYENDTLSLSEGLEWSFNVDHSSYKLNEDTIFIIQWEEDGCCSPGYDMITDTVEAYKIIYNTEQKLVLLDLTKDSLSRWVEYRDPKCNELNILEFDCTNDK